MNNCINWRLLSESGMAVQSQHSPTQYSSAYMALSFSLFPGPSIWPCVYYSFLVNWHQNKLWLLWSACDTTEQSLYQWMIAYLNVKNGFLVTTANGRMMLKTFGQYNHVDTHQRPRLDPFVPMDGPVECKGPPPSPLPYPPWDAFIKRRTWLENIWLRLRKHQKW